MKRLFFMERLAGTGIFKSVRIFATVVLATIFLTGGCALFSGSDRKEATGLERSIATSVTMEQVEEDIKLLVLEVTATNSALASLINPLQDDLKTAYGVYSKGAVALEKASERFVIRSNKMGAEGREYFNEWRIQGNTYENPRIRELSEQRRLELGKVYAQIADDSMGVQGELNEYVSNVKEVETYFSTDLTVAGVSTINPFANRTILDGFNLSVKLRSLLETVENVRNELSPGVTTKVY